jgi:hypothetical protein
MKKVIAITLAVLLFTAPALAQGREVTGNEWLKVDQKSKLVLVNDFIKQMKAQGVTISKGAEFYCKKLDRVYTKKPNLVSEPVWKVLKTAIIMEYDWKQKGVDPDQLAKDWLGDEPYKKNKARRAKK